MTQDELKALELIDQTPITMSADEGADRTLLYGYDCQRYTWHIYQKGGEIHRAIYLESNQTAYEFDSETHFVATALIPDKRLYPEACDFDFCVKLVSIGISLPFTHYGTLGDLAGRGQFIGRTF
ncbi:hypothetical protein [Bradyrhizobium sp. SZCCHNS3053]|uniref:hypothetical protein n=1 Tax=Bradyrhizobium sp. SZCCHNS3053 TaxID=3057322 RepID=UPI002916AE41|nr:hypothetical protein [Bradyrhizobium sp. SZCCHNS3053]